MRTAPKLLLLLLLAAVTGCASKRGSGLEPPETVVVVQNNAWLDMTMFVIDGGSRQRLGLVGATSTARFTIPRSIVGMGRSLRFQADPVGSRNVSNSFDMQVTPGETVRLTIPPNAGR